MQIEQLTNRDTDAVPGGSAGVEKFRCVCLIIQRSLMDRGPRQARVMAKGRNRKSVVCYLAFVPGFHQ